MHNLLAKPHSGPNMKATAGQKKMACVECRQQKSKCDAQDNYPEPCSRCFKKKIACSLQSDYKRTYKRQKLQQIEAELTELKRSLSSRQPHNQRQKRDHLYHMDRQGPSIIKGSLPQQQQQEQYDNLKYSEPRLTNEIMQCTPKQLGEVELSTAQIRDLYQEFVDKYHRFLPIVDIGKGPERIHRLCPALFWTIMLVALRHLATDVLMKLAPLLKTALAEITISPITRYVPNENEEPILNVCSVYSVQAFLIYTVWPPLTSSLSADSSWNTIGIAIYQAIRIGLNGPGINNYTTQQQQQPEINCIIKENLKTWISCNTVSQSVATSFGYPAFVSFDSSVIRCCKPGSDPAIPLALKQMVEISHFEDQVAKVLNSNSIDPMGLMEAAERLPLLKVLTQQLDELELRLNSEGLDDIRKFQLLATRVHLLTYYFLDNEKVASFELRRGLVLVYNAALNLLNHVEEVSNSDLNFINCLPGVFTLKIWQSTCIVGKLIHSSLADAIDIGTGKQLYMIAIQLMMSSSILKHDMAYRASGIMRHMWQLFKALREKTAISNLSVTIRTRMSASVFFDCLWILREQVGMIKLGPNEKQSQNDNQTEGNDNEKDDEFYNSSEDDANNDESTQIDDPGTVNSDISTQNSTTSSSKRKSRSLSNNFDAENAARKIIRTIPLDPAPISLKNIREESHGNPISLRDILQKSSPEPSSTNPKPAEKMRLKRVTKDKETTIAHHQIPHDSQLFMNSPSNLPSLDLSDDWTSGMIWKDVDSVMNDFGFHTDDFTRISIERQD